ncbi:transcriptional regulator [Ramlibacter alkalitolerans]|uniref:Transcriptional regulator n=1 Tax=Ramlibacter alkalitolerans TaxID=2039631 RepID=A0ABS1JIG8_9BURK|nr:transcriptional regulator [Ramlibacter alkalitolerans]MBL0424013.1 transcriptional regulator [Ramlibacter alkalitolerans]
MEIRLFGPPAVLRGGRAVALPPSRKVRALLAYLAMSARPATRSHLCELLWDVPNDPRGELRWCLSKLRAVLDTPERARLRAQGDSVAIDLDEGSVDALEILRCVQQDVRPPARLEALAALCERGEFLEGLDVPRSPAFSGWVLAQRRRLRAAHACLLEQRFASLPPAGHDALAALDRWLAVAPFERAAHERMLEALALRGQFREGDEHVAAAARRFEAEGQDWGAIAHAWRALKSRHSGALTLAPGAILTTASAPTEQPTATSTRRASIAVMPFIDRTPGTALRGGLGDGMAHDVITRLAKLRSVFVIAEGTMFALSERHVDSEDAGRRLEVDYVASGWLRRGPEAKLSVNVQLTQARSAHVVWAEEFSGALDDTFSVLDEIGNRIVSEIANQIETAERNRAILKNPSSLTAWESHHRGLWHMVRFHREHNEQARQFFEAAVRLDPTFARPHAGLSFTHFQDAFLGWRERAAAIEQAYAAAAEELMADDHDPASHWALGRALWLMDRKEEALRELHSAVDLSPNFALGHYTLGFVNAQSGDAELAIAEADQARALSPMDPMLFAMMASRALALLRLGRYEEAAEWGERSVARPNAHVHIRAIAMFSLALAGRTAEARAMAASIQRVQPGYGREDFDHAFRLGADLQALVDKAARTLG